MESYLFHHKDLFFTIYTDYDLPFQEVREILDYLLGAEAFAEEKAEEGGKLYEIVVHDDIYEIDVQGYEIVVYRRTERKKE